MLDYEAENLDALYLADADIDQCDDNPNLRSHIHSYDPMESRFIILNVKEKPWDNIKVREAFSYAVDKEEITRDLYKGRSIPAGCLISTNVNGHDSSVPVKKYDPEKSKQILEKAGVKLPIKVDLVISNTSTSVGGAKIAAPLKSQAEKAGFDINIVQTDAASREAMRKKGALSFLIAIWEVYFPEADGLLYRLFHSKNSPSFSSNYKSKEYDNLVEKARATMDKNERSEIYKQADKKLVDEDFAVIPIEYRQQHYMTQPWLKNFNIKYSILPFKTCSIEKS